MTGREREESRLRAEIKSSSAAFNGKKENQTEPQLPPEKGYNSFNNPGPAESLEAHANEENYSGFESSR